MNTILRNFALFIFICWLSSVKIAHAQENIPWLNDFTTEITLSSYSLNYSFKSVDNNPCKISIEEKKTDKKGSVASMAYQFYLSDLNTSGMNFKTSGAVVVVKLTIKQSQKFIRVFKNGDFQGYDSELEISLSEVEKARSFIDLMKKNIDNCKSIDHTWTSREEALDWMSQNIGKSESSGIVYNQYFKPGEKSHLAVLETNYTDSKGNGQKFHYDFSLNDINAAKINMTISGKTFKIELPVHENNYYIRLKKGTDEIGFTKELEIFSDDLEQARNILNGLVYLVNETRAPAAKTFTDYYTTLEFVKDNLANTNDGNSSISQSFSFDATPSGVVTLTTQKTDSKKQVTQTDQIFYLIDLQPKVSIEASAKAITLNLNTKDKLKYVRESLSNTVLSYSSSIEIAVTDLDKARELAQAFEFAIGKSEKGSLEFGNVDKTIDWLTANVTEVKSDDETIEQTFVVNKSNENKIEFNCSTKESNENALNKSYEFYPEDLKIENCKIKVSGKKLMVVLSTGKSRYIKYTRENIMQNYDSDIEVAFNDVLKAKNFIEAITLLRNKSQIADRSFGSKNEALTYITANIKKIGNSIEAVDQKMEQRDNDPCKMNFICLVPGSKGASIENIYEFNLADLDPMNSDIEVSSKNIAINLVTKKKEKIIKSYKNGEPGNFIANIELQVDDVLTAKKILAAFNTLVSFCK